MRKRAFEPHARSITLIGVAGILAAFVTAALLLPGAAHADTLPAAPDGFVVYSFQDSIRERGHLLEPHFPAWMRWLDGEGDEAVATVERTVYGLIRQGVPPAVFERTRVYLFPLYSLPAGDNGQFRFVAGLCGKPGKDGWLEIWLAGKWWWLEHTLVHELGHAVQYRLLGAEWSWDGKVGEYLKRSLTISRGSFPRLRAW